MRTPIAFAFATLAALSAAGTATFDDLALAPNSYEDGANLSGGFASVGVGFRNSFTDYGGGFTGWDGFAYSNVNDTTTPGFTNQYAATTGAAKSGANYAVAFTEDYGGGAPSVMTLPAGNRVSGLYVTNTTYAALSIERGDTIAKQFGGASGNDPDFFLLTAQGFANGASTGNAEFYLADYRFTDNAQDYVVRDWRFFDLSGLGAATTVTFSLTSSDNGSFGMNTPAYFALDDVQFQAVPEPASLAALALGLATVVRRRKGGAR